MKRAKTPPIRPRKRSHLETGFARLWETVARGRPAPEREFRFAPPRRWRFDFAWPGALVAVEIDGGIFIRGSHTQGVRFTQDCEKLNTATERGWRVLRYTTLDLRERPVQAVEQVLRLLDQQPAAVHQGTLDIDEKF